MRDVALRTWCGRLSPASADATSPSASHLWTSSYYQKGSTAVLCSAPALTLLLLVSPLPACGRLLGLWDCLRRAPEPLGGSTSLCAAGNALDREDPALSRTAACSASASPPAAGKLVPSRGICLVIIMFLWESQEAGWLHPRALRAKRPVGASLHRGSNHALSVWCAWSALSVVTPGWCRPACPSPHPHPAPRDPLTLGPWCSDIRSRCLLLGAAMFATLGLFECLTL